MILDAMLLAVGRMARDEHPCLEVVIFPEMRIAPVALTYRRHKVLLTGIVQCKDEMQNKGELPYWTDQNIASMFLSERLLGSTMREQDVFHLAQHFFLLVEVKRAEERDKDSLGSYAREAVGQVVALAVRTQSVSTYQCSLHFNSHVCRRDAVRFCLSDGHIWYFFILERKGEEWVYYQSAPIRLNRELLSNPTGIHQLSRILALMLQWVSLLPVLREHVLITSS